MDKARQCRRNASASRFKGVGLALAGACHAPKVASDIDLGLPAIADIRSVHASDGVAVA
jgi:hypothetical protein